MNRISILAFARLTPANAFQGTISVFEVENDGSLTRIQDIVALPPGGAAVGIAAK